MQAEVERLRDSLDDAQSLAECEFADESGKCDDQDDCGWRVCGRCYNRVSKKAKEAREAARLLYKALPDRGNINLDRWPWLEDE